MERDYRFKKLYLDVPFQEKDEAKALGAWFDGELKKWYYKGNTWGYKKFAKWILKGKEEVGIATEAIYLLETKHKCWKCGRETIVVGLGVRECSFLYQDDDIVGINVGSKDAEISLAWVNSEEEIPPALLQYMKEHYSVKTGYSRIVGSCFANHCDYCGVIQGNNYVFHEDNSPFSLTAYGDELIDKVSQIKIKEIEIEEDLVLNWDIVYCSNDYAYYKYGNIEKFVLSKCGDERISYGEMYHLKKS